MVGFVPISCDHCSQCNLTLLVHLLFVLVSVNSEFRDGGQKFNHPNAIPNQKTDQVSEGPTMGRAITTRNTQGQGHLIKVKGHKRKILCHVILSFVASLQAKDWSHWHQYLGHNCFHKDSQGQSHCSKVKRHGAKITCPCTFTLHGYSICTKWPRWHHTWNTAASSIPRSRS